MAVRWGDWLAEIQCTGWSIWCLRLIKTLRMPSYTNEVSKHVPADISPIKLPRRDVFMGHHHVSHTGYNLPGIFLPIHQVHQPTSYKEGTSPQVCQARPARWWIRQLQCCQGCITPSRWDTAHARSFGTPRLLQSNLEPLDQTTVWQTQLHRRWVEESMLHGECKKKTYCHVNSVRPLWFG